jgi:hypothetical protein
MNIAYRTLFGKPLLAITRYRDDIFQRETG